MSNAGYSIDHKITQEGQLFFDTDLFSGNLEEHYPFNFDKELLIAENVCFHNSVHVQFDRDSKRHNKVIFVASKPLNNPKEMFYLVAELTRIIEAFFKICTVQRDKHIVLWPYAVYLKTTQLLFQKSLSQRLKNILYISTQLK